MVRRWPGRPPWHVRVRRTREGEPRGAGFLCNETHIITCAHVIASGKEFPASPAFVDLFPYDGKVPPVPAEVVEGGWFPANPDTSGDIAILKLNEPRAANAAAPLCEAEETAGHPFAVYGFPPGHDGGVLACGRIIGHVEIEWIQLEAASNSGFALGEGFSGAPIWDEALGAVVGVVTARDLAVEARIGYGIPVEVLRRCWPTLPEPHVTVYLEVRGPDGRELVTYPLRGDCWERTRVTVGRREPGYPVDLALEPDPQRWVGRRHCQFELTEHRWRLTDTSTNGTFIRKRGNDNLTRLDGGSIDLQAGDVICIPAPPGMTGKRYWELEFYDPQHTTNAT